MRKLTRRELLKVSLGTMGALALANLPNWNKPALRVGVLPAHAQASQPRQDLLFTLTWNKGNPNSAGDPQTEVDMDIALAEPGNYAPKIAPVGEFVCYDNPDGVSAHLDMDNTWGFGPENIYVPEGQAMAGTYYLGYIFKDGGGGPEKFIDPNAFPITMTFTIKTYVGTPQEQMAQYTLTLESIDDTSYSGPIAIAEFPSGDISALVKKNSWPK